MSNIADGLAAAYDCGYSRGKEDALRERIERNNVTTNADHIRSMSDEELAAYLAKIELKNFQCHSDIFPNRVKSIYFNWLKQPWEDEPWQMM